MENNKIPQEINNIIGDNLNALAQLFPTAVKDGLLDVDALKEELGQFEEVDSEKYELTWSGKQSAKKLAQEDVYNRTLNYIEADSKNPDTTENLYIEGDNLEVLKLLRQNYYGSIKMIYIDPPYNTGNDFVYNDKFAMDKKESDIAEGTSDKDGNPLQKNQQSSNRYHANWLNMIYPRLKIAKDLLTDDGVIFISIDDNEVENLRAICDEVFGQDAFVTQIPWRKRTAKSDVPFGVSQDFEWIICFAKTTQFIAGVKTSSRKYFSSDDLPNREWRIHDMTTQRTALERPNSDFTIIDPKNGAEYPVNKQAVWRVTTETFPVYLKEKRIVFPGDYEFLNISKPVLRYFKDDDAKKDGELFGFSALSSLLPNNIGMSQDGTKLINELFNAKIFSYPKPSTLLEYLIKTLAPIQKDFYILDFFSGSATTAHAVMQLNAEDGGNRKFIMVQYPELTDEKSEAYKADYKNICEIGKERIRRAGERILADNKEKEGIENLDIGFKVFRTADTNIKWNLMETAGQFSAADLGYTPDLMDFVEGATDIDVVYEIMLRQRDIPLSENLEILSSIGERTYLYASSYLVCLETEITEPLIEKLAALDPLPFKFVFRDSAFQDDINLKDYSFRRLKALVERNSGEQKQTYTVEFI